MAFATSTIKSQQEIVAKHIYFALIRPNLGFKTTITNHGQKILLICHFLTRGKHLSVCKETFSTAPTPATTIIIFLTYFLSKKKSWYPRSVMVCENGESKQEKKVKNDITSKGYVFAIKYGCQYSSPRVYIKYEAKILG